MLNLGPRLIKIALIKIVASQRDHVTISVGMVQSAPPRWQRDTCYLLVAQSLLLDDITRSRVVNVISVTVDSHTRLPWCTLASLTCHRWRVRMEKNAFPRNASCRGRRPTTTIHLAVVAHYDFHRANFSQSNITAHLGGGSFQRRRRGRTARGRTSRSSCLSIYSFIRSSRNLSR